MSTTFIYALCEPDTGEVRYVGKTDVVSRRLVGHLTSAKKGKTHRACWIRSLLEKNQVPKLVILDTVPVVEWPQWEVAWIEYYREQGFHLVNGNAGGEGGIDPTPETREKIRMSKIGSRNASFGTKASEETRAKMRAASLGKKKAPFSEAHIKKLSVAHLGNRPSLETRAKMSAGQRERWAIRKNQI